jgi:hypothetical protein
LAKAAETDHPLYGPKRMSAFSTPAEQVRFTLTTPSRGVLGLVDELLAGSWGQILRLDWQAEHCRVRLGTGTEDLIEIPLPKSVVRAALARIAVLCNERKVNSVSPYGGRGELSIGCEGAAIVQVAFTNTADEQSLELVRVAQDGGVAGGVQQAHGTNKWDFGDVRAEPAAARPRE